MRIPKYVEKNMRKAHRHFQAGIALMHDVDLWFDSNGYDMETLRNCDGRSLEEIEYGSEGAVDSFLEKLSEMEE